MMSIMEEFDYLKIQIEDILSATDNFSKTNLIGGGGFGLVYKGKLSLPMGQTIVAFKRLDRRLGQGNLEFLKEITMLSKCKHENLISLLHFCSEDDERVLVYEYASRGSLDQYLSNPSLTWSQRLHICIGVARALEYLHDKEKPQGKILHRDIKSSNILLDEKWSPKVSDFGLSKVGSTTQAHTVLVSNPVGTVGYCDPVYWGMGFLSKESDIYSFGVVLFEVMCGRLCCEFRDGQLIGILVHRWKTCCDEKKVGDIIFQDIREQIDMDSIIKFSTIANQCLNSDRRKRPKIHEIIQELEGALLLQKTNHVDLVIISKLAVPPLSYKSQGELISLLSKGILVDKGKRWLSINKHEEIQELISATECFRGQWLYRVTDENSRFLNVFGGIHFGNFKADLRTQFLSPHVMYTINLVFKHGSNNSAVHAAIKYKLEDETDYLKPTNVYIREDGWLMSELYQFTSYQKEHSFKIEFVQIGITSHWRHFEGIEFRPINHEKQAKIEEKNNKDMQLSNSDTDWEPKMPPELYMFSKMSKEKLQWTTKKELYFLFRTGFLVHDGYNDSSYSWLSISKNMRYRLMKPATTILSNKDWIWTSLPESRFKVVAESYDTTGFDIAFQMKTTFLSIKTTYSCCLIYKLPENSSLLQELITIVDTGSRNSIRSLYLTPPAPIPTVGSMVDQNYASPSQNRKIKGHPKLRKDGWLELPLCEVSIVAQLITIPMQFNVSGSHSMTFAGLIIQGVEFRPL